MLTMVYKPSISLGGHHLELAFFQDMAVQNWMGGWDTCLRVWKKGKDILPWVRFIEVLTIENTEIYDDVTRMYIIGFNRIWYGIFMEYFYSTLLIGYCEGLYTLVIGDYNPWKETVGVPIATYRWVASESFPWSHVFQPGSHRARKLTRSRVAIRMPWLIFKYKPSSYRGTPMTMGLWKPPNSQRSSRGKKSQRSPPAWDISGGAWGAPSSTGRIYRSYDLRVNTNP
jgi:hypothetical protein